MLARCFAKTAKICKDNETSVGIRSQYNGRKLLSHIALHWVTPNRKRQRTAVSTCGRLRFGANGLDSPLCSTH